MNDLTPIALPPANPFWADFTKRIIMAAIKARGISDSERKERIMLARQCPNCGHVPEVKAREIEVVEGTLAEVTAVPRAKFKEQGRANSLDDLIRLGRERGYKSPEFWARKVWASRQGKASQGRHAA